MVWPIGHSTSPSVPGEEVTTHSYSLTVLALTPPGIDSWSMAPESYLRPVVAGRKAKNISLGVKTTG